MRITEQALHLLCNGYSSIEIEGIPSGCAFISKSNKLIHNSIRERSLIAIKPENKKRFSFVPIVWDETVIGEYEKQLSLQSKKLLKHYATLPDKE
jgi:hypothetical protein